VKVHPYLVQQINPSNFLLRKLWEITSVAFSAQLLTFPLSVYYFHQFPTYFLVANPFTFLLSEGILPLGILLILFQSIPFLNEVLGFILEWMVKSLNFVVLQIEVLPKAILKGFSISVIETLCLYLFLLFLILFFFNKNLRFFTISSLFIVGISIFSVLETFEQNKQKVLTFHYIPRKSGLTFIQGSQAVFMADSSVFQNPKIYDFHLKNYFDAVGIGEVKQLQNQGMLTTFRFNNQSIGWLKKFPGSLNRIPKLDYLLVSNNSLRFLQAPIPVSTLILDDSNRLSTVEKLKADAERFGIKTISLYENGAFTLK
jgi:competence protein ComEC